VPHPSFVFDTTGFSEQKRNAILAYRSQFVDNPGNRRVMEWLDAAGTYFGSRIGTTSAEPFFAREPLGLMSLDALV
jgi:LmbE family N-acetylglucosaminyl deacetylase